MQTVANQIIDAIGGTTAVAKLTSIPLSTVHSWRKNGIPASRLAHLKLAARAAKIRVDVDSIIAGAGEQQVSA